MKEQLVPREREGEGWFGLIWSVVLVLAIRKAVVRWVRKRGEEGCLREGRRTPSLLVVTKVFVSGWKRDEEGRREKEEGEKEEEGEEEEAEEGVVVQGYERELERERERERGELERTRKAGGELSLKVTLMAGCFCWLVLLFIIGGSVGGIHLEREKYRERGGKGKRKRGRDRKKEKERRHRM